MKKKLLTIAFAIVFAFAFTFSTVFAANNIGESAVEGIRNVVGGAENVVENVAGDVANGVKSGTGAMENTAENITGSVTNHNDGKTSSNDNMKQSTDNYTATRTSAENNSALFGGMNYSTLVWLIVVLAGIGIVTLVWSYVKNNRYITNHDDDDDEGNK